MSRCVINSVPLLLLLTLLLCVSAPMVAAAEVGAPLPFLFVSKTVSDEYVVAGQSVEFTVTVHNYGQAPAHDVTITDALVDGGVRTKHVPLLAFGEAAVLRYTVTPRELGNYVTGVAEVTYSTTPNNNDNNNNNNNKGGAVGAGAKRRAYSNIIREADAYFRGEGHDDESFRGVVSVVTRERYDRLHKRYAREFVAYAFLCVIPALFPLVVYRAEQSKVDLLIRRSRLTKS